MKLASEAVDKVRRAEWNVQGRSKMRGGRWVKRTRWALLKAPENRTEGQDPILAEVQPAKKRVYRTFTPEVLLSRWPTSYLGITPTGETRDRVPQ